MPIYPRQNCTICGIRFTPEYAGQKKCSDHDRRPVKREPKKRGGERPTSAYRW